MGGLAGRNKKEVRGREFRRKEEVPGFHPPTPQLFKINIKVKGPSPISLSGCCPQCIGGLCLCPHKYSKYTGCPKKSPI